MDQKEDKFIITTAVRKLGKLYQSNSRVKVIPGSASAGKTFGILPFLINHATTVAGLEVSVVSESIPHLRKGAMKDFLKIMRMTGRYIDAHYNRTLLTYTFSNGSVIEFFSADQEDKVRGPRRDVLYINECNNIPFETYYQLAIRTSRTIWLDFNPAIEFWVHTELTADPDAEWLVLTYKDNEALSEALVREFDKARTKAYFDPELPVPQLFDPANIRNDYWHNWWRVYGCGMLGSLEGVIFTNWKTIEAVPPEARLLGFGLDFGFTNDPTALVALYRWNNKTIWHELLYKSGLTNDRIAQEMQRLRLMASDIIIADSSEPKSIAEINNYGNFRVRKAVKGKDSVNYGIDVLQQEEFYVTQGSVNLIKELRNYSWDRDRTGKTINKPIDKFNHTIDAMRYLATAVLSKAIRRRRIRRTN